MLERKWTYLILVVSFAVFSNLPLLAETADPNHGKPGGDTNRQTQDARADLIKKIGESRIETLKKIKEANGDKTKLDELKKDLMTRFAIPDKDLNPQQVKLKEAIEKLIAWDPKGSVTWDDAKKAFFKVVVFNEDNNELIKPILESGKALTKEILDERIKKLLEAKTDAEKETAAKHLIWTLRADGLKLFKKEDGSWDWDEMARKLGIDKDSDAFKKLKEVLTAKPITPGPGDDKDKDKDKTKEKEKEKPPQESVDEIRRRLEQLGAGGQGVVDPGAQSTFVDPNAALQADALKTIADLAKQLQDNQNDKNQDQARSGGVSAPPAQSPPQIPPMDLGQQGDDSGDDDESDDGYEPDYGSQDQQQPQSLLTPGLLQALMSSGQPNQAYWDMMMKMMAPKQMSQIDVEIERIRMQGEERRAEERRARLEEMKLNTQMFIAGLQNQMNPNNGLTVRRVGATGVSSISRNRFNQRTSPVMLASRARKAPTTGGTSLARVSDSSGDRRPTLSRMGRATAPSKSKGRSIR